MRDAYYSDYDDEMYVPPKRSPTPRRKPTLSRKLTGALQRNPKRFVGGVLFFGIASVIALNALVMQTSRHPAPMFSVNPAASVQPVPQRMQTASMQPLPPPAPTSEPRVAAGAETAPVSVPAPAVRTNAAPRDAIGDIIRTGSTSTVSVPAPRPVAAPQPPQRRDAIGDLIRQNSAPQHQRATVERTAVATPAPVAGVEADAQKRRVMAGQQALNKLGYGPLTADGVMGAGTQKAIQRFEFDRRLPVTGKFGSQTVSELSSMSRLAIR